MNIIDIKTVDLVAIYNALSPRPVKKFSDRKAAETRVTKLLDEKKLVVRADHDENCIHDCGNVFLFAVDSAPVEPRPSRASYSNDATITVLADSNPKRKGSKSARRFDIYETGTTVGYYLDQCVKVMGKDARPRFRYHADLHWDVKHGFIEITE